MLQPSIHTFRPGCSREKFSFYLQSKGYHAGRPMKEPCANCFRISCNNQTEMDFWYAVCEMLFISRSYDVHIIGSVVPFIRIKTVKDLINRFDHSVPDSILKQAKTVHQLSAYEESLHAQLATVHEAKRTLALMAIRPHRLP